MCRNQSEPGKISRKRICSLLAVLLAAMLLPFRGPAEVSWKENTPAQQTLKVYITNVNSFLAQSGEQEINTLFEMYDKLAVMGTTMTPGAETPEGVEVTVTLTYDSLNTLQLRVNDVASFPRIAAAFLRALNPEGMTAEEAIKVPSERAGKAVKDPDNSFEDEVEELNGTSPRTYYAYYPNQYHDGINWIQMTIIFPLAGYWDGKGITDGASPTKGPDTYSGNDAEYDGYFSSDDYSHLEIFTTPTPEPDSPAGELENNPLGISGE